MSFRVYGNGGCPIVAFPTQDGMCDQWEGFGMVDILQDRNAVETLVKVFYFNHFRLISLIQHKLSHYQVEHQNQYADGHNCARTRTANPLRSSRRPISFVCRYGRYQKAEQGHLETTVENIESVIERLYTCNI